MSPSKRVDTQRRLRPAHGFGCLIGRAAGCGNGLRSRVRRFESCWGRRYRHYFRTRVKRPLRPCAQARAAAGTFSTCGYPAGISNGCANPGCDRAVRGKFTERPCGPTSAATRTSLSGASLRSTGARIVRIKGRSTRCSTTAAAVRPAPCALPAATTSGASADSPAATRRPHR